MADNQQVFTSGVDLATTDAKGSMNAAPAGSERARVLARVFSIGEVVAVLLVGVGVVGGVAVVFGNDLSTSIASVWVANLLMLGLIYAGLKWRGQNWADFGLTVDRVGWRTCLRVLAQSFLVFVFAIAAFVVAAIVMANLVGMPEGADMSKYNSLRGNLLLTLLALLSVYLVSSFAEEVIYRGFMITRLTDTFGSGPASIWVAVAISSLVFGLVHSDWGVAGMVQATCMGVALGISYLAVSRNLWVTILAHAYMDTILVLQMYAQA